jgi:hypothetical protein
VLLLKKGGNAGDISTLVRVQVVVEQSGFVRSTSTRLILNKRKQLRLQEKKKNNNFLEKHVLFFFQTETTHNQHDAKIQPYKNFPTTLPAAPIPLLFSQRFPKLIKLVGMILQKVNLFWVNSRAEQINKPIYALLSVPSAWEPSPQET